MKFRPCIDLHNGKVKQIVGSSLVDGSAALVENFVSEMDSTYYARMYRRDELKGGHVIMLGPGNNGEALKAIKEYPEGFQVGGGINADNAANWLENGASHVIVTSWVFKNGHIDFNNLESLVSEIGKEKLVLDLSCRERNGNYYVVTDRWQKFTDYEINKKNIETLSSYCDEFLVHAADVEGMCRGIHEDLVTRLGAWACIPVTYAGGARSIEDMELVRRLGNGKVDLTIGSALDIFGGSLPYKKVIEWNKKYGS